MLKIPPKARTIANFTLSEQVGAGSYGKVYRAIETCTGEKVALKLLEQADDSNGFSITSIREIKALSLLSHKNIIRLREVVTGTESTSSDAYMVFDFVEYDFEGLMAMNPGRRFSRAQLKCFAHQMLGGLVYVHSKDIIHRDLKLANILLTRDGCVKIADFGLSRSLNASKNYTNQVVTIWYRSPELLFGITAYNKSIDMWSIGLIISELLLYHALLPGKTDHHQIELIFTCCGAPANWTLFSGLSRWDDSWTKNAYTRTFGDMLKRRHIDSNTIDFLDTFLQIDPAQRISASDALASSWFKKAPLPCYVKSSDHLDDHTHESLADFGSSCHQYEAKQKRLQDAVKNPPHQKFKV